MASPFFFPGEVLLDHQTGVSANPEDKRYPSSVREKRPRVAKTKLSEDPSVYIDDCPDSPKRQKVRPKERSCRVPVSLHPRSSSLASTFILEESAREDQAIKGMAIPTISMLQSIRHVSEWGDMLQPSPRQSSQAISCQKSIVTDINRECGGTKPPVAKPMKNGHIVPITMVSSLPISRKELELPAGLSLDDQASPQGSKRASSTFEPMAAPHRTAMSPSVQQHILSKIHPHEVDGNEHNSHNGEAGTADFDKTTADPSAAGKPDNASFEPRKKQEDSECADSELSLPSIGLQGVGQLRENLVSGKYNNTGRKSTEIESVTKGEDGMVCCGGIRHVPPVSAKLAIPVVEGTQLGKSGENNYKDPSVYCTRKFCSPVESEETQTASIASQSDCDSDGFASRKTMAQSPKTEQAQHRRTAQVPTDPMTEKLISLDISLNVAQKCFDHRSLLVILDYLLHIPLRFPMLQGCALGQTVNNLRKHDNPDVARLATILVRLWRWIGGQYLKEIHGAEAHKNMLHHGRRVSGTQKNGPRSTNRTPKSSKDLTSSVHRMESVIRDL